MHAMSLQLPASVIVLLQFYLILFLSSQSFMSQLLFQGTGISNNEAVVQLLFLKSQHITLFLILWGASPPPPIDWENPTNIFQHLGKV